MKKFDRKTTALLSILALSLLAGCSADSVNPVAATGVVVASSATPVPQGCHYLGQVTGSQGNFFTGGWTSNKNLATGSMNQLKNNALALGANYVQMLNSNASNTGTHWGPGRSKETGATQMGSAYRCPPEKIGLSYS